MNSFFLTDGYKTGHHQQYPKGTTMVFSNFTPRSDKYAPDVCKNKGVVVFGVQMVLQQIKEHFDKIFTTNSKFDSYFKTPVHYNNNIKNLSIINLF